MVIKILSITLLTVPPQTRSSIADFLLRDLYALETVLMSFGSSRHTRGVAAKRKAPDSPAEFDCGGRATDGVRYKSINEIVDTEFNSEDWYGKSTKYWENQSASIDGMLGGLGDLDGLDVETSRGFLEHVLPESATNGIALDCGAGIGRVTRHLLLPMFGRVDMLEQNEAYIDKSAVFLRDAHPTHTVDLRICTGMQDFTSNSAGEGVSLVGRYSLIWIQYVQYNLIIHWLPLRFTNKFRFLLSGGRLFTLAMMILFPSCVTACVVLHQVE